MTDQHQGPDGLGATGEKRAWLRRRQALVDAERRRWGARESAWSWARLGVFVLGLVLWWCLEYPLVMIAPALAAVALVFAWSVWQHGRARRMHEFLQRVAEMLAESQRRLGGEVELIRSWQRPTDAEVLGPLKPVLSCGATWAMTDQEREDLDLYAAPVGVFGLLNRTSTAPGARRLRDWLDRPGTETGGIAARREGVRHLGERSVDRQEMMAAAAGLRGSDDWLDRLHRALRDVRPVASVAASRGLRVWSVLTGVFTLMAVGRWLAGRGEWLAPLGAVLAVNAVALAAIRGRLKGALEAWRDLGATCGRVLDAARCAAGRLPSDGVLGELRSCFEAILRPNVLPSLRRRVAWTGSSGPIHELVNLVCLYDLHVAQAIVKRAAGHRDELLRCLSALADLEALMSLACFAWEQPEACWPALADAGRRHLAIAGGCHPLIDPDAAVANDMVLSPAQNVWVVTGPNTAGKSTLLRMVGVNVLLSQVGTCACAREMALSPVRLITDLRVRDSLARHESYFLSEVRHVKRMLLPPAGAGSVLGLIDEPFRGTNSREKRAAGLALVEQLAKADDLFVIATHEDALTRLADEWANVANHHFRERVRPDGIDFDYRLHPGPATTTTAIEILRRENYPEDLVARAKQLLAESGARPDAENPEPGVS